MKDLLPRLFSSNCPTLLLLALFAQPISLSLAEEQGWETCQAKNHYLSYESKPGVGGRHYESM